MCLNMRNDEHIPHSFSVFLVVDLLPSTLVRGAQEIVTRVPSRSSAYQGIITPSPTLPQRSEHITIRLSPCFMSSYIIIDKIELC